jgi:hypothetical protein
MAFRSRKQLNFVLTNGIGIADDDHAHPIQIWDVAGSAHNATKEWLPQICFMLHLVADDVYKSPFLRLSQRQPDH